MIDYTAMTGDHIVEFLKAKGAIQDYITFLVVRQKITKTTEELSSHLSNLIADSILTWSDPDE
jgi:hypothetical protein